MQKKKKKKKGWVETGYRERKDSSGKEKWKERIQGTIHHQFYWERPENNLGP